jgi:integrase
VRAAKIAKFRWHDLRHHFASRLFQASVPLNTVHDLLGNSSFAMTLRYAHLAPDQKREAVERPLTVEVTLHDQRDISELVIDFGFY